jgi:hypothetical protein
MNRAETERVIGVPWTAAAPLLCAVHCLAAPLFLVVAPALADNRTVEVALMAISAVIALVVVSLGTRRHGEALVWLPVMLGLAIWLSASVASSAVAERVLMVAGGVLLAGGLYWDARLRHRATCTTCRGHG